MTTVIKKEENQQYITYNGQITGVLEQAIEKILEQ